MFQVKIGRRHIVMPGARIRNTVVRMLMPVRSVAIATSASPRIHRSVATPGERRASDSGGYAVQPIAAPPPAAANPDSSTSSPPPAKNQYDSAFSRGNAMSGAPICSGIR